MELRRRAARLFLFASNYELPRSWRCNLPSRQRRNHRLHRVQRLLRCHVVLNGEQQPLRDVNARRAIIIAPDGCLKVIVHVCASITQPHIAVYILRYLNAPRTVRIEPPERDNLLHVIRRRCRGCTRRNQRVQLFARCVILARLRHHKPRTRVLCNLIVQPSARRQFLRGRPALATR